jgi:predicted RNase H-like HicB family nuclease
MMNFTVVLEEADEGGYTVTVPALPGCISEGDTYEEAVDNIKDAVQLYLRAVSKEVQQLKKRRNLKLVEISV